MAPPLCSPRSACSTAASSVAVCSATATANSSAFSTPSSARFRPSSDPRGTRQLCHAQASQSAGLAGAPPALDLSLHPDLGILAQRRREFLLQNDAAAHPPWRLPLDR